MDELFSHEVRPYLDLIDTLRHAGVHQDISLPQIAVMGDQSSGKSSVLHSLSGVPFPKGSGLVTRCPTQLIMSKSAPGSQWTATAAVGFRNPNQPQPPGTGPVSSVEQLTEVISHLTNVLTKGKANGFSTDSIVIRISSPSSPDLTIIDLPGIVRTTTHGQDSNVIQQVNELISSFMMQPNTIILAVVPSNQDIATVDILERAHKVDPQGVRTLGVLTKPDLIGEGNEEEVVQVLCNIRKPLNLGYIMVKNQSQKDVADGSVDGQSMDDARRKEEEYFRSHRFFSCLPSNLFGAGSLTTKLTKVLVSCIKRSLPSLKWEMEDLLSKTDNTLRELGWGAPSEDREKQSVVMEKVSNYCKVLRCSSRGEYKEGVLMSHPEHRLHAHIQRSFKALQANITAMRPLGAGSPETMKKLEAEMGAQRGRELPGFLSSQVFYGQIIELVDMWRPAVDQCVSEVAQHVRRVSTELADCTMVEFPNLSDDVKNIVASVIEKMGADSAEKIESLIVREQDPFTAQDILLEVLNGIRFRAFDKVLLDILDTAASKPPPSSGAKNNPAPSSELSAGLREEVRRKLGSWYIQRHGVDAHGNVQEMATLIQAYWDVASRRLVDNVCMCVEMEFTNKVVRELEAQCFLHSVSMDKTAVERALKEDSLTRDRREQLLMKKDRLLAGIAALKKTAPEVVSRPPDVLPPAPRSRSEMAAKK